MQSYRPLHAFQGFLRTYARLEIKVLSAMWGPIAWHHNPSPENYFYSNMIPL